MQNHSDSVTLPFSIPQSDRPLKGSETCETKTGTFPLNETAINCQIRKSIG